MRVPNITYAYGRRAFLKAVTSCSGIVYIFLKHIAIQILE